MTELHEIIEYVKESCAEVGLINCSQDMILDCATRIYNSQSFKESKETPIENKDRDDAPPATDKQIDFLINLGYQGNTGKLSIVEAKHLIEELKAKKRKQ